MFGGGEIVVSIGKQRLLLLSSSALKLLCCAAVAPPLLKCHTLQGNEFRSVDKNRRGLFHSSRSGAPVALTGQKGIRCEGPAHRPIKSGAASPSSSCHWAAKAWEGG